MMRYQVSSADRYWFYEKTKMLPNQGQGHYGESLPRRRIIETIDQPSIERSVIVELSRKVDWLIDEVRSLKQIVLSYQQQQTKYRRYQGPVNETQYSITPKQETPDVSYPYRDTETVRRYIPEEGKRTLFENEQYMYGRGNTTFPYELLSRCDRDSHCSSDSPVSNSPRFERNVSRETPGKEPSLNNVPSNVNIAEIILLFQRGLNDTPAILNWSREQKLKYQGSIEQWYRVYNLFSIGCNGDMGKFLSKYTDSSGNMMSVDIVASMCPDVTTSFDTFIQSSPNEENFETDGNSEKIFTLPRKINGRKVSAKDVIQLWEHGMGDIPPIKSWTKTQKFKQQSKISRWKKIVDIFKYQCHSDMRKFEDIYSDVHGCLLPVAAITSKFETIYGDELNITSKLMTVSTAQDSNTAFESRKRSIGNEELHETPSNKKLFTSFTDSSENTTDKFTGTVHSKLHEHVKGCVRQESFQKHHSLDELSSNSESELDEPTTEHSPIDLYMIPLHASIQDLIKYWMEGSSEFPPINTWTTQQKFSQKELVNNIEKLYFLYSNIFKYDVNVLLNQCKQEDGRNCSLNELLLNYTDCLKEHFPGGESVATPSSSSASSLTFDCSHHKTISESTDSLYLLPRKINGRKVNAKDVLQLWYFGLNKIPAVKQWSPQQKAVQQSKISRWKKIVDLFEQDFSRDWEKFEAHFSNGLGQLLPITAIIAKHEEDCKTMGRNVTGFLSRHDT